MLPDPIPYSQSESLFLWQRFLLLVSCFLDAFLSVSIFLLNCAKEFFVGLVFYAFLGGPVDKIFHSIFLVPMTIFDIVHGICAPMVLAHVAMLIGVRFLGNPAHRIGARSHVTLFVFVQSYLVGLCAGSFLGTYALNSLERQEKQTFVRRSHTFLVKVELILPCLWAHANNLIHQISLSIGHFHRSCAGLGAWAIIPARQLCDVGVKPLHMLHILTNAGVLGLLENVCDIVPLFLSCIIGKQGEKVEHHALIK
jgi:hypothetical protein